MENNNNNISSKNKTIPSKLNNNTLKKEKCPKCNEEIYNNKLKEHLQTAHLTEIIDNIYIGSFWNAINFEELEKNNIKYILNCASECKNRFEDKIKYLKLDNVLIHCMEGKSRSTTLLMAYLIKIKKENTNSAYKIVKKKRQLAMPNLGFMSKLREFEASIEKDNL